MMTTWLVLKVVRKNLENNWQDEDEAIWSDNTSEATIMMDLFIAEVVAYKYLKEEVAAKYITLYDNSRILEVGVEGKVTITIATIVSTIGAAILSILNANAQSMDLN